MEKRCKEGWMAACAYYSAMIKDGMSPAKAIAATRKAAGKVGVPPKKKRKPPFDWQAHLKEHHPSLFNAAYALREYTTYRAEMGFKRWTQRTWMAALRKWECHGWRALEASIERTIENGWQGVFEPGRHTPPKATRQSRRSEPTEPTRSPRVL